MIGPDIPPAQDIVLLGGGHAHALVLRMWGMDPLAGARLTLINPHPTAPYTGMLPGFVAGHYRREDLAIDMVSLATHAGARLILDRAAGLDRAARQVVLASGRRIRYDILSIDIGITSQMPDITGFSDFAIPVKPMDDFARAWVAFRDRARQGAIPARVAIIGGGLGGAELALAVSWALRGLPGARVTLIDAGPIGGREKPRLARTLRTELESAGVALAEAAQVAEVTPEGPRLADGTQVAATLTIGAAGARAQGWLAGTGLALTDGFVDVGPTLQSVTDPDIFAAGDCAHLTHAPRPKAGVFSVRAAPVLLENLRARAMGSPLGHFHPQRDYLKIVSLGDKRAIAEKWGLRPRGAMMWHWKDWIDRRFMSQFQDLAPMSSPDLPRELARGAAEALGPKPMCGGCGAKVGPEMLGAELAGLAPIARPDVLSAPGDDAAILAGPDGQMQVVTTDHLRAFVADPALMARIALIHALGDIWAMGAATQAIFPGLILPRAAAAIQRDMLREIMEVVRDIAGREGAAVAGGHTSVGAEMTLGFTVTGLAQRPITLAGARPGDALILTKPIGSGTIMAGVMSLAAHGREYREAIEAMCLWQGEIARHLAQAAHAMTDVTGFGLAGHAAGLARASGLRAVIALADVPFMAGALRLAQAGVASTLYPQNRAPFADLGDAADPRVRLLHDPQTAGGLLAAVPADRAGALLGALSDLGASPAIIGRLQPGTPGLSLA